MRNAVLYNNNPSSICSWNTQHCKKLEEGLRIMEGKVMRVLQLKKLNGIKQNLTIESQMVGFSNIWGNRMGSG